jgi:hypothetical protein
MNTGEVECNECLSKNSDNEIKWDIRILHFYNPKNIAVYNQLELILMDYCKFVPMSIHKSVILY